MKKMKVTKTLYTNKIKYAYISVEDSAPVTREGELTVYSGEAVGEEKAKKILKGFDTRAVYLGVEATSATYSVDAYTFIDVAEVINE